ncbi:MAG: DDE-type integrase/transposase/recombinase [Chloroflexi bacterium]|nr:DDE-type integrase/transposase/recombinase [Chloroflexota bacterium]
MPDEIFAHHGHRGDPQRRWLRHTYQEGPGFRFLATRGGRPPAQTQRRSELALVRARSGLLRVMREEGLVAALALGRCSRASLFRWQGAYERGGLAALVPGRRGPRAPQIKHPAWLEQVVIAVRLATYWNAKRISAELRRREIASVGQWWIERLFDDLGTARPSGPRPRGPRYERESPNSLWHIDIKGPFFIQLARDRYLKTWIFGLVDDHSRYVLGLRIQTSQAAVPILEWIRDCFELCGRPLDLMSDNGSPFVFWMPGVLTQFGKTLRELAIRHIRTQVNSPWTNGKIEAFWATLKDEVLDREIFRSLGDAEAALERFAGYYNYHRLHGEIGWLTPGERYDGTPFTDRGFDNIPALAHLQGWLEELRAAA